MIRRIPSAFWLPFVAVALVASDQPHDPASAIQCTSCHKMKNAPGANLTAVAGNANLCRSCHLPGGLASGKPLTTSDQALPGPGLPAGVSASGNSHRWDSGPAGHVSFQGGAPIASTGSLQPLGAYTGTYSRTYTITITAPGAAGGARFSWTATGPGGGSGADVATGSAVLLGEGVSVRFTGTTAGSFQAGDRWYLHVRPGLRTPEDPTLSAKLENGQIMCSTCHDQHSQDYLPFDPAARSGGLRHFMRVPNDTGQMCVDCHAPRNVTSAAAGSHPVGVPIPSGAYKNPAQVPLDATLGRVQCQSCHQVHNGPMQDGTLLRSANVTGMCADCHTLADPAAALHMNAAAGVMWPGGQYGSTFPAKTDGAQRGSCAQCHQPHGWPDSSNPAVTYPKLLVERPDRICATCHDADGPSQKDLQTEFAKASSHPLTLAEGAHTATEPAVVETRHVDCRDCHNPHMAAVRVNLPGASTSPRPASGPVAGVRGVNLSNAEVNPANYEYEICLRCHGDSPGKPSPSTPRQFPQPNLRMAFNGAYPSFHPVAAVGKNPNVPSLLSGWSKNSFVACTSCHNNSAGPGNGGAGPNGAHGSANPKLLERAYATTGIVQYSEAKYALCFKCHSAASVMGGQSFHEHDKHVRGSGASCNVCHDPHASSGNRRLINFDTRVVTPYNGVLEWKSYATFTGECTLVCHGEVHTGYWY